MSRQFIWTGVVLLTALIAVWALSTFVWLPMGQRQRVELARKLAVPLSRIGAEARANGTTLEIKSEDFDSSFKRQSELQAFASVATMDLCNAGFDSLYFYRGGGLLQPNAGSRFPLACDTARIESARHSVETLNLAERTYADAYNAGFSHALSQLGPPTAGSNPGAAAAGLIGGDLASGIKDGYSFAYTPKLADSKGHVRSYIIYASPVNNLHDDEMDHFFTDQSGVVRVNKGHAASAADPPVNP